jgi:small subunit ribosomal protein S11
MATSKDKKIKKVVVKKVKKVCPKVQVFVNSSYNNTLISICDMEGNVLAWSSPGVMGFKGSRESTAYAATKAAEDAYEKAKKFGVVEAIIKVNGTGAGRNAAVKGLRAAGLRIRSLMDVTSIPHGGCSPKKKTRS